MRPVNARFRRFEAQKRHAFEGKTTFGRFARKIRCAGGKNTASQPGLPKQGKSAEFAKL
jgi:hypothetical protein